MLNHLPNKKLPIQTKIFMQIFINEPDEFLFSIQSIIPVHVVFDSYAKSNGREAGNFYGGARKLRPENIEYGHFKEKFIPFGCNHITLCIIWFASL